MKHIVIAAFFAALIALCHNYAAAADCYGTDENFNTVPVDCSTGERIYSPEEKAAMAAQRRREAAARRAAEEKKKEEEAEAKAKAEEKAKKEAEKKASSENIKASKPPSVKGRRMKWELSGYYVVPRMADPQFNGKTLETIP